MSPLNLELTDLRVHGKHKVLGVFHDATQRGTFCEFTLVWERADLGGVFVAKVGANGRAFEGQVLTKENGDGFGPNELERTYALNSTCSLLAGEVRRLLGASSN